MRQILGFFSLSLVFVCSCLGQASNFSPKEITIVRDSFGVPHIYSKTDAGVAYGLAWAQSEDDFNSVQEALASSRGQLGRILGKEGVIMDFLFHYTGVEKNVKEKYNRQISPDFKLVLEAYAAGINQYARLHPKEIKISKLFPVTGEDIIRGYTFTLSLFSQLPFVMQAIMEGRIDTFRHGFFIGGGSNAFAANSNKTLGGGVFMNVNSHQPLEGRFAWYEAHLHSEEGWNIIGGVFPGGVTIFHGTTPNLSWAHTFNWPDLVDFYKIDVNPANKWQYKYDGNWQNFEVRRKKLSVKIGPLVIKIPRKFLFTEYGPAIRTKHGTYATRICASEEVKTAEQWYRMNKSQNIEDFLQALNNHSAPLFNLVYADKADNIMYLHMAQLPKRKPGYHWLGVLPGNTSDTRWTEIHPLEKMPKIINPTCGYIFNTNNTPFSATCPEENLKPADFDSTFGLQTDDNNRSRRLLQLFQEKPKISWEDFKKIKYDRNFPKFGPFYESVKKLFATSPEKYPELAPALKKLNSWDMNCDADNKTAALAMITVHHFFQAIRGGSYQLEVGIPIDESLFISSLRRSYTYLMKHYNTLEVTLGQVQRHIRGKRSLPIGGLPDVVAAIMSQDLKNGQFKAVAGESYIQLVHFNQNQVHLETVNAYGASARPNSPHYTDQMELFISNKTKTMTFQKEEIFKHAVKIYQPK